MSDVIHRLVPMARTKGVMLAALRRSSEPLTTGQLAERAGIASGSAAARLIELEDEGFVERVPGPRGRGFKATWRATREQAA